MMRTSDKNQLFKVSRLQKKKKLNMPDTFSVFLFQVAITLYNSNKLYFETFKPAATLLFSV